MRRESFTQNVASTIPDNPINLSVLQSPTTTLAGTGDGCLTEAFINWSDELSSERNEQIRVDFPCPAQSQTFANEC